MEQKKNYIVTGAIRLSYAHLFKPYAVNPEDEKYYSTAVLIPKSDKATIQKIKEKIKEAIDRSTGDIWKEGEKNLHIPLRDGDEERSDDPNYKGMYFMNMKSKNPPVIINKAREDILDSTEVYSGCWARVQMNFYGYNKKGKKGIGVGLLGVQKIKDDEALGGARGSADAFDDGFESDDDDDLGLGA